MSYLELPGYNPEVPQFLAVPPPEAQIHIKGIMSLMKAVLIDPSAQTFIEVDREIGQRRAKQVAHRAQSGVALRVVRGSQPVSELGRDEHGKPKVMERLAYFSEMWVTEPDGSMILTIDHGKIPWIDLRDDPFTATITDAFRSHLTAS